MCVDIQIVWTGNYSIHSHNPHIKGLLFLWPTETKVQRHPRQGKKQGHREREKSYWEQRSMMCSIVVHSIHVLSSYKYWLSLTPASQQTPSSASTTTQPTSATHRSLGESGSLQKTVVSITQNNLHNRLWTVNILSSTWNSNYGYIIIGSRYWLFQLLI